MAKNSIRDYSATNSLNTDIQSIDISEGCSPAGINNAIREVMADLKDVSTGAVALESPSFDQANFADNAKAIFGAGSDLQIYHDGSNSIIAEASTGSLKIQGSDLYLTDDDGTNMLYAANNGGVTLYNGGGARLATTATGCDVTGTIKAKGGSTSTQTTNAGLIANSSGKFVVNHGNEYGLYTGYINSTNDAIGIASTTNAGIAGPLVLQPFGGNVGIGTSSVNNTLEIKSTTNDNGIRLSNTVGSYYHLVRSNGDGLLFDADAGNTGGSGADIRFQVKGTEGMRLTSAGNLLVGVSSTANAGKIKVETNDEWTIGSDVNNGTTAKGHIAFYNPNGLCGYISTSGTSTAYNTSSDYRLKENVTADWDATTRLKQLNPVRFNFIADADTTVDGFLAHEVQDVVPEAITGTKDGMRDEEYEVTPAVEATYDDEGNVLTEAVPAVMGTRSVPDYQGIDQSKLVPLLVKTIQELEARITALEAN